MKSFEYKALMPNGKKIEQVMRANAKEDVAVSLRSKSWKILSINEVNQQQDLFKGKVSTMDKANFCRYISVMIRSGLSMTEAVEIMYNDVENNRMKEILNELLFDLQQGDGVAKSLGKHVEVFDKVFIALVNAGEKSGSLEKTFAYLADQQYSVHRLNKKIKGAMMYPAVIMTAMFGVGVLMMTFVLPRLGAVFLKMKIPLPTPTRLLLEFGKFMGENVILVFGTIILVVGILSFLFTYHKTKRKISGFLANAPILKNLFIKIDLARFSRTLATLLQSGVPIMQALGISAEVFSQWPMQKLARSFSKGVSEGKSIAYLLSNDKDKIFPSIMIQTIKTGEETGTLDTILFELAEFYEAELEDALKEFSTILEPIIMLVIGVGVGTMVVMIISPIYSVLGGINMPK